MIPSIQHTSPDRNYPGKELTKASSPTSVAFSDIPVTPDTSAETSEEFSFTLPTLENIDVQLDALAKKSATSKALYQAKLQDKTIELREAQSAVAVLKQELQVAKTEEQKIQRRLDASKHKREREMERLEVRKLHLDILKHCLETEFVPEIVQLLQQPENEAMVSCAGELFHAKYTKQSNEELKVIRKRLQGILDLLDKATEAELGNDMEMREQADLMRRDAVSTYVLFQRYHQV